MSKSERQSYFANLVPELNDWNTGDGIEIESWLSCVGRFDHAIAYLELAWPSFVIYDGCVLGEGFSEAAYHDFLHKTGGDRRVVEATLNHIHISSLFSSGPRPTAAQIVHLGRRLQQIWSCKLSRDFPEREIVVAFSEGPFDDLWEYELTVHQRW